MLKMINCKYTEHIANNETNRNTHSISSLPQNRSLLENIEKIRENLITQVISKTYQHSY
jgi:hypothetical protein